MGSTVGRPSGSKTRSAGTAQPLKPTPFGHAMKRHCCRVPAELVAVGFPGHRPLCSPA